MRKFFFLLSLFIALISNAKELLFLGVPLGQDRTKYHDALTAKRFNNDYPNLQVDLGGCCWSNGDFWKFKECMVILSDCGFGHNIHRVYINVPMPDRNVHSWDEYVSIISELVNDYAEKYGEKYKTEERNNKDGKFVKLIWEMPEGNISIDFNASKMWAVEITYETATIINKRKEEQRYRGKGIEDL